MNTFYCVFDGSCEPVNPGGRMGIGARIYLNGEIYREYSQVIPEAPENTNNVAEYMAVTWVLDTLLEFPFDPGGTYTVEINGDSNLVNMQLNRRWRVKEGHYAPFARAALSKYAEMQSKAEMSLKWIPAYQNAEADRLSRPDLSEKDMRVRVKGKRVQKGKGKRYLPNPVFTGGKPYKT